MATRRGPALIGALLLYVAGGASAVADDASYQMRITARAEGVCRVTTTDAQSTAVQSGSADLGAVSELCNSPSGYVLLARVSNVKGGRLMIAGVSHTLSDTGEVAIATRSPQARTVAWRLADAQLIDGDASVTLTVALAPA
jgi:hypothetical protein